MINWYIPYTFVSSFNKKSVPISSVPSYVKIVYVVFPGDGSCNVQASLNDKACTLLAAICPGCSGT